MTDNDHVRAIRTQVLAINDVEKKLAPMYEELRRLESAARDAGLKVEFPFGIKLGTEQPRITREVEL